ncbi:MEMO1 protein, partial [Polypterus senegalus]
MAKYFTPFDNRQCLLNILDSQVTISVVDTLIHAGYTYCGACAAFAYKQVDPSITRRVFILGPSHHVPLSRCALSPAEIYRTPLYDLRVDQKIYADLWKTGMFERMSLQTDEDEHSIEMHLPYTAKTMESHKDDFSIVPVLVGALSESKEHEYGKLLSKYLADPSNLFVISSDFCHWGQRFRYQYYDESQGEIYRSIENLDKMGMNIIEQLDPVLFSNYLKKYHNTICGRHPIGVLLNASFVSFFLPTLARRVVVAGPFYSPPEEFQGINHLVPIAPPGGAESSSSRAVGSRQLPLAATPGPNQAVEDSISHGALRVVGESPTAREAATKRPGGGIGLPMAAPPEHKQQRRPYRAWDPAVLHSSLPQMRLVGIIGLPPGPVLSGQESASLAPRLRPVKT